MGTSAEDIVARRRRELLQQRGAAPPTSAAGARFLNDMQTRMARGPLETSSLTSAGLPVGSGSNLSGTGREVQHQQNQDQHQINRQKRVQRLLDRAARKGDIGAAIEAERFGARMRAEGGPTSQVTSHAQGQNFAREQLSLDWQAAQELRRAPSGGVTLPPAATASTLEPEASGLPPVAMNDATPSASPGEWSIPPADATSDSGINASTSANLREVPESEVATPPTRTFSAPPAPNPPGAPYGLEAAATTPQGPVPSTGLDAAAESVIPEVAATAEQRAARAFGNVIFNEGIAMQRDPATRKFVPMPPGVWDEAVERERTFMGAEAAMAQLDPNAAWNDPEFIARTNARIQAQNQGRGPVNTSVPSPATPSVGGGMGLAPMPGGLPTPAPTPAPGPVAAAPLDFQPAPSFAGGNLPPSGRVLNEFISGAGKPIGMPGAESFLPTQTEATLTAAWEAAGGLRSMMSPEEASALAGDPSAARKVMWLNALEKSRERNPNPVPFAGRPVPVPGVGPLLPQARALPTFPVPGTKPAAPTVIPGTNTRVPPGTRPLADRLTPVRPLSSGIAAARG